jgi:hypothetical protein
VVDGQYNDQRWSSEALDQWWTDNITTKGGHQKP